MSATTEGFGIDIGGTGIKGARVDLTTGELLSERNRMPTPSPSTAEAVAEVVAKIVNDNGYTGEVGITFPAVIQNGVAHTAANVDKSWVDADVRKIMSKQLPGGAEIINDADAAGIAEVRFGAGKDQRGTVLLLTFGTGIGSALFTDGHLVPNTEFGHIELDGKDAEKYAAASVKDEEDLSYKHWAKRVSKYLRTLEKGLWPDLIIAGGGVSKKAEKWIPHLECRTPVVPAKLLNNAGIVGAALAAYENRGE
ncbi:polyphosphate glucokinase [Antricoccus suffuscus]|uniref:Polyphosphate glucokinase n=1 Tax=Antricoccus suffuscus TaxID=1629062 RepID=A0A2T1A523_9ACTN|nr:ROK family protein [Antricoccus suffuscus]PRZ43654.1 polyphosphate glucokinase [Antricoccus suffuscus]